MPIVTKKEVLKKTVERGFQETLYKGDQILVCWKDNQPVYVATNKFSVGEVSHSQPVLQDPEEEDSGKI